MKKSFGGDNDQQYDEASTDSEGTKTMRVGKTG